MSIKISLTQKIILTIIFFTTAAIGFMFKLPSGFRHIDKELHTAFYFAAAAFLNILFARTRLVYHLLIFGILYLMGMGIEYAQDYSNKFYHHRIHGRYDPEDVKANLQGLIAFTGVWVLATGAILLFRKKAANDQPRI